MATPPRGRSNTKRPGTTNKRPTTIDLDAKDVKDATHSTAKSTGQKTAAKTGTIADAKSTAASQDKTSQTSTQTNKPTTAKSAKPSTPTGKAGATDPDRKKPAANPVKKPAAATTKAKPTKGGTSFGKLAAAGIIGGVITLGGAGAMQYSDLLPNLGPISDAPPIPTIDLTPLQSKITQLQDQVDSLSGGTNAKSVDLSPLEKRLAVLEKRPLLPTPGPDAAPVTNQQLAAQITQFSSEMAALKQSVESMNVKMAEVEDATPKSDVATQIDLATAPLKSTSQKITSRLGELEQEFAALSTKVDEDVNSRLEAFDNKLKSAATGEKLAKSVAVNALKTAIEKGEPFSGALTSLETLTGPSKQINWLKSVANKGIPTNKNLQSQFDGLKNAILRAASDNPDASLSDRLMSSISSLVTVSSDEPLPGGSPQAIVSRISANMKSGNLGSALGEWKSLPEPARQVSKAWMENVNLRLDADRQIYKLLKSIQSGS